jgi:[lysine-biosynthesis-protein LysW]--L-2-aminoadipate ligase
VAGFDGNRTSVALVSAWRRLGVDTELVSPQLVRGRRLCPDDTVLGRLDVLPTLDAIEPGLLELLWLERRGLRVFNRASTLLAAHDKLRTARDLIRAGLPQPTTRHVAPEGRPPRLALPVVLKPRFGSWGKDVFRCETRGELERCLEDVRERPWFRRHGALLQQLIRPRGYDLRILVAGGRAVGAIQRLAAPGEWRTNISLGGTRHACVPPAHASALAVAAAAAIGGDLVGVDLLPADGSYAILELNAAVEFDDSYSLPGRDVYADALDALGHEASARTARGLAPLHR